MNEELVTGYVTKYALTKGIIKVQGLVSESGALHKPRGWMYIAKKDWETEPHTAIEVAELMRIARIASLEKQIKKLQTMEIKIIEDDA